VYNNVPLEDISQTVIDPVLYASIRSKYEAYCDANGNLEDAISKNTKDLKAALPKIRGTRPTDDDFYTFIPKVEKDFLNYYNAESSDFGVVINVDSDKDNVYDYLRSYVARFGLALLKFSQNTANKEFALVPLVDFTVKHTDRDLFNMLGLTAQEIDAIKKVICNYYAR
jgi:predicted amino acid-binding ACT domain protein